MHEYKLLEILAAGFVFALIFGYIAHRLKLSPIVGYLVAGIIIGPATPGFVADMHLAMELAEAGVILLMFGVGLHFHMEDLLAVKGVAIPGALAQTAVAVFLGFIAAECFGYSLSAGLLLGLGLAVASTVVLLRVLTDANVVDTVHGHVAIGWLVVEDIITVLALVILPSLAGVFAALSGVGSIDTAGIFSALGMAMVRLIALWLLVLVVGGRVVPWLLTKVVRTRSQELFTLAVLVAAFATAVGAAVFFQASMALGAFLGGMVVGKTKLSHQAGADLLPLRDAFSVLFFLSVGMLFDPYFLVQQPLFVMVCMFIVIVGKPITALLVVSFLGYSARTGLTVALGLAQVGEFSFILAQLALDLKLIPQDVYSVLVVCAMVSITMNPGLFRSIPKIEAWLQRRGRIWRFLNARADAKAARGGVQKQAHVPADTGAPTSIIVGYGPTGRSVCAALSDNGIVSVVIDLNVDTVNNLAESGRKAVFGDSSKREVLQAAGIERAQYLVISIPVADQAAATAAMARLLNPDVRILTRTRFLGDEALLHSAGVTGIAYEEQEIAKALTSLVLDDVRRGSGSESAACSPA